MIIKARLHSRAYFRNARTVSDSTEPLFMSKLITRRGREPHSSVLNLIQIRTVFTAWLHNRHTPKHPNFLIYKILLLIRYHLNIQIVRYLCYFVFIIISPIVPDLREKPFRDFKSLLTHFANSPRYLFWTGKILDVCILFLPFLFIFISFVASP